MRSRQNLLIMKHLSSVLFIAMISFQLSSQDKDSGILPLQSQNDSLNYFLGINLGYSLETAPFDPDLKLITEGMKSVLNDQTGYDQVTAQQVFQGLHQKLTEGMDEETGAKSAMNLEKGQVFLAENRGRPEIITTESGLQYEILQQGEGPRPVASSTVEVHYEGKLIDGTVFDSSYERGESISFPLNRVISGWTEGLQLMPLGSTYRFYIPPELGYGARATGSIPPNSVLIFKVELLGIE